MQKIEIKVTKENKSFAKCEFVEDDYIISKGNKAFESMVTNAVKESGLELPDTVKISTSFEWYA